MLTYTCAVAGGGARLGLRPSAVGLGVGAEPYCETVVERARASERGEAREISDRLIGLIGLPVSLFVRLAEKANSRDVCERFVHCPLGEIDLTCDN